MALGVFLALLAYGLFACADALIKSTAGELSVFQVGFFTALFSVVPALLTKSRHDRWRDSLEFCNPLLLNLRGLSGVVCTACVIYAFTHVPLADAYSLAFLAPMIVVALSSFFLREKIPPHRVPLMVLSFVGVLIVVRPGFRELQWGHLAALGCALFTATNTILLRSLAPREHRLSIFTVIMLYALSVNGLGMLVEGFNVPDVNHLAVLMGIGMLGGFGSLAVIQATKYVPANQIAPAQYTQMAWALALGAAFYGEYVDLPTAFGVFVLVTAGLFNVISEQNLNSAANRLGWGRGGLPSAVKQERDAAACMSTTTDTDISLEAAAAGKDIELRRGSP